MTEEQKTCKLARKIGIKIARRDFDGAKIDRRVLVKIYASGKFND